MLEQYAGTQRFAVWLKVDTGMNRLGFRTEEFAAAHARLAGCAAVGDVARDDASGERGERRRSGNPAAARCFAR